MQTVEEKRKRIHWIDMAKLLAIFAVMIDHTNGSLYTNQSIAYMSEYSVSLFILMMGITSFWSMRDNRISVGKKLAQKSLSIIRPYLVATFIYYVFIYRQFNFVPFLDHIVHFNVCGPFYYVLVYIELVIVSPILYKVIEKINAMKYKWIWDILFLLIVLRISSWTTLYTNILSAYGGGGKLLGGTYLFLFCLGMLFGKYYERIKIPRVWTMVLFSFVLVLTIGWGYFITIDRFHLDTFFPFGKGSNPPSVSSCIYASLLAVTLFLLEMMLDRKNAIIKKIFCGLSLAGKHTLYIFLYHILILDILGLVRQKTGIVIDNMWVKRIVYFGCMLLGSWMIEIILEKFHEFICGAYRIND